MKMDMFGEIRVREGYDPDDVPGPQGISFNELKRLLDVDIYEGWAKWKFDKYHSIRKYLIHKSGDKLPLGRYIGNSYLHLHQIIWVFAHDGVWVWPPFMIDHKDGNNAHNFISNLREVTRAQNNMNKIHYTSNSSGYPGVRWDKRYRKWKAYIFSDKYLGWFDNVDDAIAVRKAAELEHYGEYSREASRGPFKFEGPDLFA